jgi:hypothetical protein
MRLADFLHRLLDETEIERQPKRLIDIAIGGVTENGLRDAAPVPAFTILG